MISSEAYPLSGINIDWRYHDRPGEPHPFNIWLDALVATQEPVTRSGLREFLIWLDKTWSAPTSAKDGDRILKYLQTPASLDVARVILAELFTPYMTQEIWCYSGNEIKLFWYLVWLHVRLGEDKYLGAMAQTMVQLGKLSHLLHLNGYLRWRDGAERGSPLAARIAEMTDSDPIFTQDLGWLTALETGIPAINKKMNRLYNFKISMRLEDREQQVLVSGQGAKLPAIRAGFSYPIDRNKGFQWHVQVEQLYTAEPDLGIKFQQGQNGQSAYFWPPLESKKPRTPSAAELALRATEWPCLDSPGKIPALVREIISTFGLNIDITQPKYFNKRETKLLGAWLAAK